MKRMQSILQSSMPFLLGLFLEAKFIPADEQDADYVQFLKSLLIAMLSVAGTRAIINTPFWNVCFKLSEEKVLKENSAPFDKFPPQKITPSPMEEHKVKTQDLPSPKEITSVPKKVRKVEAGDFPFPLNLDTWLPHYPGSSSPDVQQGSSQPFDFLKLLKSYNSLNPDILTIPIIMMEYSERNTFQGPRILSSPSDIKRDYFPTHSVTNLFGDNAAKYKAYLIPFYVRNQCHFIFAYRQDKKIIIERYYQIDRYYQSDSSDLSGLSDLSSGINQCLNPIFSSLLPDTKKIAWKANKTTFQGEFESSEYWALHQIESVLNTRSFRPVLPEIKSKDRKAEPLETLLIFLPYFPRVLLDLIMDYVELLRPLPSSLFYPNCHPFTRKIKELLEEKYDPDQIEENKTVSPEEAATWLQRQAVFCKSIQGSIAFGQYYCGTQRFTPIQQAVRDNCLEVIRLLINAKADLTGAAIGLLCLNHFTHTVKLENTHYRKEIRDVVELLLETGLPKFIPARYVYTNLAYDFESPFFIDQRLSTPFSALIYHYNGTVNSFSFGSISLMIGAFLDSPKTDINAVNPDGSTALSNFVERGILPSELASNHTDLKPRFKIFEKILKAGADLTHQVSKEIPRVINNQMQLIFVEDVIDYTLSECSTENPNKIPELEEYLQRYYQELLQYVFAMGEWCRNKIQESKSPLKDSTAKHLVSGYNDAVVYRKWPRMISHVRGMRKFLIEENDAKSSPSLNRR